jgi:membrane carboxypeptidase/penicillin-binding protein PbpC
MLRLERADGSEWRPEATRDVVLFSAHTSEQVASILADPAARHRRFGRGLPVDPIDELDTGSVGVALKTGTASGMSDLSAIVVSPEFTAAAWTGRFDGRPTQGLSGMWGALPLARRALSAALSGRSPRVTDVGSAESPGNTPPLAAAATADVLQEGVDGVDQASAAVQRAAHDAPPIPTNELEPWAERARARLTVRRHAP